MLYPDKILSQLAYLLQRHQLQQVYRWRCWAE